MRLRSGTVVATTAVLLTVAFWNRYPLVTSDTGTYVHSSFTLRVPSDRPVFYGLFLAATHLGHTLWLSIIAQSLVVAIMLTLVVQRIWPAAEPAMSVAIAVALVFATSLPWLVGQVSPDVFTGLLVIGAYLVATDRADDGRWPRTFAIACFVFSIMVHSSHLLLGLVLAAAAGLAVRGGWRLPGTSTLCKAVGAAVIASVLGNLALSGKAVLGRGSHAFLMARLIEDGVIERVLDERCADEPYRLCAFRGELPTAAEDYLWRRDGLLQRTGGFGGSRAESTRLIRAALVDHPGLVLRSAVAALGAQLVRFRTGDGLAPPAPDSWVEVVLTTRLPDAESAYRSARQHRDALALPIVNGLHEAAAVAAALALSALIVSGRVRRPIVQLAALVGLAFVVNAAITGALSGPHDRYQSRVVWLIVLAALFALADAISPSAFRPRPGGP